MYRHHFPLMNELFGWLRTTWAWPGLEEVGRFLGTHLISGMIPAFFIAGAIAVFLDKQRITRLMGPQAPAWVSYPIASFAGAILTVCSCGVIPIFTGILQQGAGIGPAFTFLFSSPAVNLIALTYTTTFLGLGFTAARIVAVIASSIAIGLVMRLLFREPPPLAVPTLAMAEEESDRTDGQTLIVFLLLLLIMLTSTGIFDRHLRPDPVAINSPMLTSSMIRALDFLLSKLLVIFFEIAILAGALWKWFRPDEVKQWLKKSWSLFVMIFPTVLLGIFISGLLAALVPLTRYMSLFSVNSIESNLLASLIGSLMYFGTIVGVNIVATLVHFGMHTGPALTLILSGPAVSLPSVLALQAVVGRKKAVVFLLLVMLFTALSGYLYGML
ncbi:MAG TPA: permease [Candidatus Ozemobacteraceae bacterium]|nr:permease [Candidatus Ozemobacteraceae bacterium]